MRIHHEVYEHPSQASRVRLNVYEYRPESTVMGLGPPEPGYLVTEDRVGTTTVVATLGYFPRAEEALARVRDRAHELHSQSYRSPTPAA